MIYDEAIIKKRKKRPAGRATSKVGKFARERGLLPRTVYYWIKWGWLTIHDDGSWEADFPLRHKDMRELLGHGIRPRKGLGLSLENSRRVDKEQAAKWVADKGAKLRLYRLVQKAYKEGRL